MVVEKLRALNIIHENVAKILYKGKYLGTFPAGSVHRVTGKVYAISDDMLYIEGFSYDGSAPDAFFWAGTTPQPSTNGFIIPDSLGRQIRLQAYNNQNLILKMPGGRKIKDVKWISIWCRLYTVDFGHIKIPDNFDAPKEVNLGRLPNFAHGVSASSVIVKDAKTIQINGLYYDGSAPDAFFLVGKGNKPHGAGIKVPDENGSLNKIHGYRGHDITLRLPGDLTVADIDWFSLYCITYAENFGHVKIPNNIKDKLPADLQELASTVIVFPNCETIFKDLFQVSWEVREPEIYIQLEARIEADQYISFGLSGSHEKAQMVGADVAVAYFDSRLNRAIVQDYILTAKAQCNPQSNSGACPDYKVNGGQENLQLVSWSHLNGFLNVVYKRQLDTGEDNGDQRIVPEMMATVIAAIGQLNSRKEAAYHSIKYTKSTDVPIRIAFSRPQASRNCDAIMAAASTSPTSSGVSQGWKQAVIRGETTFRAQIGPTGGSHGYTAITGIQSWGIAWWINGHLIPEIHVERGKDYTFIVEGGDNPAIQASYHPLYITNNKEGGGAQFPDSLNTENHKIYAGVVVRNGSYDPSPGSGRYCEWKHASGIDRAEEVSSFEEYKRTLSLTCSEGIPGRFVWRPDENTPDIVYYQVCYTHRNLGWKIIVDSSNLFKASPAMLLFLFFMSRIFV
ncbi:Protein Skeletor:-like isoforms D/E [Leptotrombidium deliense]|uniref:Protein Skeletor:-like isoforms D/E n=1 Tax=Leptotrombidium deliense TaxID=299467 RepID=A0A443SBD7_9ACAR|nr:Protein Skeletor:-like isoforms D/E [Leptotrombidium deliense]